MPNSTNRDAEHHPRGDNPVTPSFTFKAARVCVFCHTTYDYPLTGEDRWTAIPVVAGGRDDYWRCPTCTTEDRRKPA